jgi:hypothetical protein
VPVIRQRGFGKTDFEATDPWIFVSKWRADTDKRSRSSALADGAAFA